MKFTEPLFSKGYLPVLQPGVFTIHENRESNRLEKVFSSEIYCFRTRYVKPLYAIRVKLKIKEYAMAS